jgi:hypothetical protein
VTCSWVYGLQQVHEMLAGSHAGQELNYLLSVGSEAATSWASSDAHSAHRRSSVDTSDGHGQSVKSAAVLQADSHMKHVDVYVRPITANFFVNVPFNRNRLAVFVTRHPSDIPGAAAPAACWAGAVPCSPSPSSPFLTLQLQRRREFVQRT